MLIHRVPPARRRPDHGQAAIVVVVVAAALLVVMVTALATMGRDSATRTRAQTAADAAALASVDGDRRAAVAMVSEYDAVLVAWERGPGPDEVTVTIRLDGISATARATNAP